MVKTKHKLEKILIEEIEVKYKTDRSGFYIPYCRYRMHPRIIDPLKAEICEQRKCWHYKRIYL